MQKLASDLPEPHRYHTRIYYEDTDVTGLVYHPNYFKFFERARSEFFGPETLRIMQTEEGIGVVVYRAEITFKKGAILGDWLEIQSRPHMQGNYRVVFQQAVYRIETGGSVPASNESINQHSDRVLLVEATIELVCVAEGRPVRAPTWIVNRIQEAQADP